MVFFYWKIYFIKEIGKMADELNDFYQNEYLPKIKELETALSQQKSRSDMLEEKVRRLTLRQTRVENTV